MNQYDTNSSVTNKGFADRDGRGEKMGLNNSILGRPPERGRKEMVGERKCV